MALEAVLAPELRRNFVLDPPILGEEGDGGWVVGLTDSTNEPLFDLSAIGGNFGCCLGVQDSAIAAQGTSALVYVKDQLGEGLDAGTVEMGVLVRPVTADGLGAQQNETLATFASANTGTDSDATHPYLIKAYSAGDRIVVIDFLTNDWWRIEPDGEITAHQLSRPVMREDCTSEGCIDTTDIQGITGRNLVAIEADRSRLVLHNPGRASSGSVALVSIDLESGAVAGPVDWQVPSDLLTAIEDAGSPTCRGTETCVDVNITSLESDPTTSVLNTFDPETLEVSYPVVPDDLAGLTPTVLGDGLLWTGGPTVYTDMDGTVRWELGAQITVAGRDVPDLEGSGDRSQILLAQNESGEVFRLDIGTGEIADPVELDGLDGLVDLNDEWAVVTDQGGALFATPIA